LQTKVEKLSLLLFYYKADSVTGIFMYTSDPKRPIPLYKAFIPLLFLIGLLSVNVYIFGVDAIAGPNQLALIFSALVAALVAFSIGFTWEELEKGILNSLLTAMPAILILLLIGALAGTWIISGIVPAMIYYGLKLLSPDIFLFASCFICAVVSLATGSSWTTVATIGLSLAGIGETIGFSGGIIGGAIISGAYFGDKVSPISDTTNLASAMTGVGLFEHIRYLMSTTMPAFIISLVLYLIIGLSSSREIDNQNISAVMQSIENIFYIGPVLMLIPVLVIVLIVFKVPAFPALLAGTLGGAVFALVFQRPVILQLSGSDVFTVKEAYIVVLKAMYSSIQIVSDHELVSRLLASNGMVGMLNTVWLIICAMIFGGTMEASGLLYRITRSIINFVKSTGSLIASTVGTCIFFNITASDQYLAIMIPGRMFRKAYEDRGLSLKNLSRTLEDSGTVTSVLVPWNTCGATQAAVLGIATVHYLPYCFFNLLSPLIAIIFAYMNIRIEKKKEE